MEPNRRFTRSALSVLAIAALGAGCASADPNASASQASEDDLGIGGVDVGSDGGSEAGGDLDARLGLDVGLDGGSERGSRAGGGLLVDLGLDGRSGGESELDAELDVNLGAEGGLLEDEAKDADMDHGDHADGDACEHDEAEPAMFVAELHPLNAGVCGIAPVTGTAEFSVGATFEARVWASGLEPNMLHPQHIHAADTCPPPEADTNGDGFIDVIEGLPFYGEIMIPLDANLANLGSETSFPMAEGGTIDYEQSTSTADLTKALAAMGYDGINLPKRHVVLHGVSPDTDLPDTVQSLGGLPAYLTLPVACGEIAPAKAEHDKK